MADNALLKAVADRGSTNPERHQLQRLDWLQKALQLFVEEGIDAVRITRLADELDVTRGSVYWHFTNRDDLIGALLEYWRDKNTRAIADAADGAESLIDGIFRLFEACIDVESFDPRLDLAVREWARRSETVRGFLDRADSARVEAITALFSRFGYEKTEAFIRARIVYFSQIGFYALDIKDSLATRISYTPAYFKGYTGQELTTEQAREFETRIRTKYQDRIA
ncbi:MAG: TetR/AcrR family transcriptional regulator [bacterium]